MNTSSESRDTDGSQRERFGASLSLPMRILVTVYWTGGPLTWLWAWLAISAWHVPFRLESEIGISPTADTWHTARSWAVFFLAICIVTAALHIYVAARITLFARRGAVVFDATGIEILDWRGRAKRLGWEDVRQIDIISCGGLCHPPKVRIKTSQESIGLPLYLRDRTRLISEMISRRGLQRDQNDWLPSMRERYTRDASQSA